MDRVAYLHVDSCTNNVQCVLNHSRTDYKVGGSHGSDVLDMCDNDRWWVHVLFTAKLLAGVNE